MTDRPDPARGRRTFLLLAAIFGLPLLAAWLLYFHFPEWIPQSRTNYGTLVAPARPLPELALVDPDGADRGSAALKGKWTWVQAGGAQCEQACRDKLHQFRQVRAALNEKRERVQRVYLAPDRDAAAALRTALAAEHPDLQVLADPTGVARQFFAADAAPPGTIFLLDPLGNWLMSYPPAAQSRGIYRDIKRLLRVSQIG